ncbi:hypothetical protein PENANT_c013G06015 [Penicillium antarcticum]|uniref:DUF3835 domain-containing protein n=1 Tax=Penicillium antarcticum TaxID=416450 RepID=A0A1V6Q6C1_9EURO|nr:uncharacterized protein N7508_004290 [Penicillium antarcticum]KAJ5308911.1 hypothetical protein N7508_004290 [Penicillium antarcticum]OQD84326.1 hypothetical protein PENANT_c013G06015 [Penicillium antarcticum]
MGVPNHSLDALEEQRLALENNILQLQKSLYHWRTWEAEYDGLREEIGNLGGESSTDDFLNVALEFGGTLVDEKEMQAILGSQGVMRSRGQVIDLLGRRIDYVKQNVATMEKRVRKAEDELSALGARDQPLQEGGEFPMQEIMEELDEDGNVVSSSINTPGSQASELLDVLKKAGVKDIPDAEESKTIATPIEAIPEEDVGELSSSRAAGEQADSSRDQNAPLPSNDISREDLDLKRPVSVVTPEDRQQPPVTDVNENVEDARLRREMLQYGIDEVGAIVAELEMNESGSDVSFDEDYDYDYDEEDNEDEYGRSHTALPEDYHQQMRELEAKLNARGLMNMGKDTQTFPEEVQQEIGNITVVETETESTSKDKKPKKRVAFADNLDIAPAPETQATAEKISPPQDEPKVLADSIVERTSRPQEQPRPTPSGTKKASRFKSARGTAPGTPASESVTSGATTTHPTESRIRKQANATPSTAPPTLFPATPKEPKPFSTPITDITENEHKPYTPKPPQDRTLAEKVFERQVTAGAAKAPELDHYDEELHQKQIASEFFHMQNRMSGKSGSQAEEEQVILPPEPEEPPKRVSKFKASRMG